MKTSRMMVAACFAAAWFPAISATALKAADAKPFQLIDFTDSREDPDDHRVFHVYGFNWGDWDGRHVVDMRRKGTLIQAKGGKGGLGENSTGVKFAKAHSADLLYVVGGGNKAKKLSLSLTDGDGTQGLWTIPLEDKPLGQVLTVHMDLTKPDSIGTPGKTPGLDLSHISDWQVQGDFSTDPVRVILIKLLGEE